VGLVGRGCVMWACRVLGGEGGREGRNKAWNFCVLVVLVYIGRRW